MAVSIQKLVCYFLCIEKIKQMKKTIILPTDFSDNARNACAYAFGLFGFKDVRYILLNAYDVPFSRMDILMSLNDLMSNASQEGLESEIEYFQVEYQDEQLRMETYSKHGSISEVIDGAIELMKPDFVVMGTKGATGLEQALVGTNTARVIRNMKCPIIIVPNRADISSPKRIAFAADYEKLSDIYSLEPLRDIALANESKLFVFNVKPDNNKEDAKSHLHERDLHRTLKEIPHSFARIYEDDVTEGIEEFVEDNEIHMLAMVARQHNFFERLLHRSVTERIAMELDKAPILIIHEK